MSMPPPARHDSYTVVHDDDDFAQEYAFLSVDPCSFMARPPVPHNKSSSSVSSLSSLGSASTATAPPSATAPQLAASSASIRSYSPGTSPGAQSTQAAQQQAYLQQHASGHPYSFTGPNAAFGSGPSSPGAGPSGVYSAFQRVDGRARTVPPRRPLPSAPASPHSPLGELPPLPSLPPLHSLPPLPRTPLTPVTPSRHHVPLPPAPSIASPGLGEYHTGAGQQVTVTVTHAAHAGKAGGLAPTRASLADSLSSKGTSESACTLIESAALPPVPAGCLEKDGSRPGTPSAPSSAGSVHAALPREAQPFRAERPWLKRVFYKASAADIASLVLQGWPESDAKAALALCQSTEKAIEYLTLQRTKDYSIATLVQDGYRPKAVRDAVEKYPNADVANAYLMHTSHCDLARFSPVRDCMWCDAIVACRRGLGAGDSRILGAGTPIGYGFSY